MAKSFVYLQLGKGETTTGTDTAVVLDGRAPHNGTQLVDGARGNSGGLRETGLTTAVLATGLYPKKTLSVHHAQKNRPEQFISSKLHSSMLFIRHEFVPR